MKNRHLKNISVFVLAGFICAVGSGNPKMTSAQQTSSILETEMGTPGSRQMGDLMNELGVYKNIQANFSFKIPSSWNGHYKVRQYAGAEADEIMPSAKYVVSFDYVTTGGEDSQHLVKIYVFSKQDWACLGTEEDPVLYAENVFSEANGMVYVVQGVPSCPFDDQSEDGKRFEQLYFDLDVQKAFAPLKNK